MTPRRYASSFPFRDCFAPSVDDDRTTRRPPQAFDHPHVFSRHQTHVHDDALRQPMREHRSASGLPGPMDDAIPFRSIRRRIASAFQVRRWDENGFHRVTTLGFTNVSITAEISHDEIERDLKQRRNYPAPSCRSTSARPCKKLRLRDSPPLRRHTFRCRSIAAVNPTATKPAKDGCGTNKVINALTSEDKRAAAKSAEGAKRSNRCRNFTRVT